MSTRILGLISKKSKWTHDFVLSNTEIDELLTNYKIEERYLVNILFIKEIDVRHGIMTNVSCN